MFGFLRTAALHRLPPSVRHKLATEGLPTSAPLAVRGVLERPGTYSGRWVTEFRVFDLAAVAERALHPHAYADLDLHQDLVVRAGRVERDGSVFFAAGVAVPEGPIPARVLADRASHTGDEHLVFWNPDVATATAARLSSAAVGWLKAVEARAADPHSDR